MFTWVVTTLAQTLKNKYYEYLYTFYEKHNYFEDIWFTSNDFDLTFHISVNEGYKIILQVVISDWKMLKRKKSLTKMFYKIHYW